MSDHKSVFAQQLKEAEEIRIKSDMSNLASASMMLDESILEAEVAHAAHIKRLRDIQAEISEMGNSDTYPTSSQVRLLYQKAMSAR